MICIFSDYQTHLPWRVCAVAEGTAVPGWPARECAAQLRDQLTGGMAAGGGVVLLNGAVGILAVTARRWWRISHRTLVPLLVRHVDRGEAAHADLIRCRVHRHVPEQLDTG